MGLLPGVHTDADGNVATDRRGAGLTLTGSGNGSATLTPPATTPDGEPVALNMPSQPGTLARVEDLPPGADGNALLVSQASSGNLTLSATLATIDDADQIIVPEPVLTELCAIVRRPDKVARAYYGANAALDALTAATSGDVVELSHGNHVVASASALNQDGLEVVGMPLATLTIQTESPAKSSVKFGNSKYRNLVIDNCWYVPDTGAFECDGTSPEFHACEFKCHSSIDTGGPWPSFYLHNTSSPFFFRCRTGVGYSYAVVADSGSPKFIQCEFLQAGWTFGVEAWFDSTCNVLLVDCDLDTVRGSGAGALSGCYSSRNQLPPGIIGSFTTIVLAHQHEPADMPNLPIDTTGAGDGEVFALNTITGKLETVGETWADKQDALGSYPTALTDSTGGTAGSTLSAVGDTSASDQSATINDNFASLAAQVEAIRAAKP